MALFPEQMYDKGFITNVNHTQSQYLNIYRDSDGDHQLVVIEKAALGALSLLQRFLVWLGFSSCNLWHVTRYINDELLEIEDKQGQEQLINTLIDKKTTEQIQNLAFNIFNLNKKIDTHNDRVWFNRNKVKQVNDWVVAALLNRAVVYNEVPRPPKGPPPPPAPKEAEPAKPEPVDQRRWFAWFASKEVEAPKPPPVKLTKEQERALKLEPFTAQTRVRPNGFPNVGRSCHLNAAFNFLAGLPPVMEAFHQKLTPSDGEKQEEVNLRKAVYPVLDNQVKGGDQPSKDKIKELITAARQVEGLFKNRGDGNIGQTHCAHEDVDFFLDHLDASNANRPKSSNISFAVADNFVFPGYEAKEILNPTEGEKESARQIGCNGEQLAKGEPFSYTNCEERQYFWKVSGRKTVEEALLDDCSTERRKDHKPPGIVRSKDGKFYKVTGKGSYVTRKLADAPEVLMVCNKRGEYKKGEGSQKDNAPCEAHEEMTVPGRCFVDGNDVKYVLCTIAAHEGKGTGSGHYVAYQKRQGQWMRMSDSVVFEQNAEQMVTPRKEGFMYGYVREDVYNASLKRELQVEPEVQPAAPQESAQVESARPPERHAPSTVEDPYKPYGVPNLGLTCHLCSAVNVVAGLPPLVSAMEKAKRAPLPPVNVGDNLDREEFEKIKKLRKQTFSIFKNQAFGLRTAKRQLASRDIERLISNSENVSGTFKNRTHEKRGDKTVNTSRAMHDAEEDVTFFLHKLIDRSTSPEIIYTKTRTFSFKANSYRVITLSSDQKKAVNNPHKINITAEQLKNRAPCSFHREQRSDGNKLLHLPSNNMKSFDEACDNYFALETITRDNGPTTYDVITTDGEVCRIETKEWQMGWQLSSAPEVLVVAHGRFVNNGGHTHKLDHDIETPEVAKIPGKYFTDGNNQEYVLCSIGVHDGSISGGHYWALQKRNEKWFTLNDKNVHETSASELAQNLRQGYLYGYVRRDVYERLRIEGAI